MRGTRGDKCCMIAMFEYIFSSLFTFQTGFMLIGDARDIPSFILLIDFIPGCFIERFMVVLIHVDM